MKLFLIGCLSLFSMISFSQTYCDGANLKDLHTGKVLRTFQVSSKDAWNAGVDREHGIPSNNDVPIMRQVTLLQILSTFKNVSIVVWSGGGKKYAENWGKRLGIDKFVWRYASKLEFSDIKKKCNFLIAIDDIQATRLGDANLIVREK